MRIALGTTFIIIIIIMIFPTKSKIILENEGLLILSFYLVLAFHEFETRG